MSDDTRIGLHYATDQQRNVLANQVVDAAWARVREPMVQIVIVFFEAKLGSVSLMQLETALLKLVLELGRCLLELTLNACEPDDHRLLPKDMWYQWGGYRVRNKKTCKRRIATRFGDIALWRFGYRSWEKGESGIIPLEMLLGIRCGATPALVDWIGRAIAAAGANQNTVIELLRQECGVSMGVGRLRDCVASLAEAMEEHRQEHQAGVLLDALNKAVKSSGSRKPVLSVGRDGITLRQYATSCFEVATTATLSVYDRAGKRLCTVYLAWPPELGQATMDKMLNDLLSEVFSNYHGPLPRLAYVTDSGSNEEGYYERYLVGMLHPLTQERLEWIRVADFYHASERIWKMADYLFGKSSKSGHAWARRMLKLLKEPNGASRVLQSCSNHLHHRRAGDFQRSDAETTAYWTAYRYIRNRVKCMRYSEFKSLHIPLGSGVTEAACKTVFTQRLKNSGMRWSHEGAVVILRLRTILLSQSWSSTYAAVLTSASKDTPQPYPPHAHQDARIAA